MSLITPLRSALAATLLVALSLGCAGDGGTSPDPLPPAPPPPPAPVQASGTLEVSVTTTGEYVDPDGYLAALDGSWRQDLRQNGVAVFRVPTGSHSLFIEGISLACQLEGTNPRSVTVSADTDLRIQLDISCTGLNDRAGGVEVRVNNQGSVPAQGRFGVTLDGAQRCLGYFICAPGYWSTLSLEENSSVTLRSIPAGTGLTARLTAPANCVPLDGWSRTTVVVGGVVKPVSFEVSCQ